MLGENLMEGVWFWKAPIIEYSSIDKKVTQCTRYTLGEYTRLSLGWLQDGDCYLMQRDRIRTGGLSKRV